MNTKPLALIGMAIVVIALVTVVSWQLMKSGGERTVQYTPEQEELLSVVEAKVELDTKGLWDNQLEIREMHADKDAYIGSWVVARSYWGWIAWRDTNGPWQVLVSRDGFDCDELAAVPSRFNDFFRDVVTAPSGDQYCYRHDYTPTRYQNKEFEFSVVIPEAWESIGYSVLEEPQDNGVTLFRFVLHAKDTDGSTENFSTASLISATPTANYVEPTCGYSVACTPGEWVGENAQYVFVSENFSPEAFGICTKGTPGFDQVFYDANTVLCDKGRTTSYPERVPGQFSIYVQ